MTVQLTPIPSHTLSVLVVEDDEKVAQPVLRALSEHLSAHGLHARTLAEANDWLSTSHAFDLVILDLNLPDGSGLKIAEACRQRGSTMPILMLTAEDAVEDRVRGLRSGADDYLCKPFVMAELVARVEALLRRTSKGGSRTLRFADVEVDLLKREVRRGATRLTLSTRELDLLAFFMTRPEQVIDKATILREVWGGDEASDVNLLQVYANYLRNKLEHDGQPRLLHTVRGVGYVLSAKDKWT